MGWFPNYMAPGTICSGLSGTRQPTSMVHHVAGGCPLKIKINFIQVLLAKQKIYFWLNLCQVIESHVPELGHRVF